MSDTPNEFDQVDDNEQEPGKLRQLLKQAHAQLKQKDKELTDLRTAESKRNVDETWTGLKVPEFYRGLYKGEETPEAMKQWWEASKGFFNIEAAEERPAEQQATPEELAAQEAAQQFQDASSLGTNAISSGFEAAVAQATKAKGLVGADFQAARKAFYEMDGTPEYR